MLSIFAQATSNTTVDGGDVATLFGVGLAIMFLFGVLIHLILAFITSFIFKKAGRPMWAAYVPIYNSWVLFEIAGKPGWWVLLNFIPIVGSIVYLVLYIVVALELAKRFGKGVVFAILGLVLFPIIGVLMLAFGKSKYTAPSTEGQSMFEVPSNPPADTTANFAATPPVIPAQPPAEQPVVAAPASPEVGGVPVQPTQPQPPQNVPLDPQSAPQNENENRPLPPAPPTPPANPVV